MKKLIITLLFITSLFANDSLITKDSQIYKLKQNLFVNDQYELETVDPLHTDLNYPVLIGMGAVTLGVGIGVHLYQANAWWRDKTPTFRVVNDWNYALWIDKTGHFFGTNLLAHGFSGGLEAANMDSETSAIVSASLALAFQMYVEIEDGYGANWGFSPGDAIADVVGASYYLGQYYFPALKHIQPRVSYWPTDKVKSGDDKAIIIDDYEGQKYWLGVRVKEFLPKNIKDYWPSFLMVSVGMGVKNLDGKGGGTREFYLALDLDAEQIPLYGGVWQWIKNTLNYIHFPMPGIRITPNTAFFAIVY